MASFDAANVASTLQLMKNRNCNFIKNRQNLTFMDETNKLLKNGLIPNLIKSIEEDVMEYARKTIAPAQFSGQPAGKEVDLINLRKKGEILFFTFYQTQIEDEEERALVKLIKFLSNLIVAPNAELNQGNVGGINSSGNMTPSWQIPVCSLLVILELAHVAALQQTTYLLSRNVDYSTIYSLDELQIGNTLTSNKPGHKYDINNNNNGNGSQPQQAGQFQTNSTTGSGAFKCDGVKGLSCLAYAILRQPDVDSEVAPALDVEYFLYHACTARAYSYIRLVVLPILQTSYIQDKETTIFYIQILCELLENLAKIFCMSQYKQDYALGDVDFPYVFFPPSQSFYANNMAFYNDHDHNGGKKQLNGGSGDNGAPITAVDTLEDVLLLYSAVLEMRPEFAHVFWPEIEGTAATEDEEQGEAGEQSFQMSFNSGVDNENSTHPFVLKVTEASYLHPTVLLTTIQFVSRLASAPLGSTAMSAYLFVKTSHHSLLSWGHFFDVIDKIAMHLGAQLTGTTRGMLAPPVGMTTYADTMNAQTAQIRAHHHARGQRVMQLTEKDIEGLVAIMDLISRVASSHVVAQLLLDQYPMISRLFSLLSCPLPIALKGSILQTLAVLAKLNSTVADEIWSLIEFHRLLPSAAGPGGSGLGPTSSPIPAGAIRGGYMTGGATNFTSPAYRMDATMSFAHSGGMRDTMGATGGSAATTPVRPATVGAMFGLHQQQQQTGVHGRDLSQTIGLNAFRSPGTTSGVSGSLPQPLPNPANLPPHSAPGHSSHSHERGLRAELEDNESKAGQYPVTEGFLQLLTSLLVHHIPSSSPDASAGAASEPSTTGCNLGILLYLEYIIQDVLLHAHERTYAPEDSPLAYGQRFRVTARCLKVLTLVLQHYRVNALPDDALHRDESTLFASSPAAATAHLLDLLRDFREETVSIKSDGSQVGGGAAGQVGSALVLPGQRGAGNTPVTTMVRPKSAGFYVMTQLLTKSRLFSLLLNLLAECHSEAVVHAFNTQALYSIGNSVQLLQQIYTHGQNPITYNLHTHSMVPIDPLNLTELGMETQDYNACDGVYWRERTVAAVVGLFYECSLREQKFATLFRSANRTLTVTQSERGRVTVLPVQIEDFSTLLISSTAVSLVAHFIAYTSHTVPSIPSIPVSCLKVLEHIALHIPNYQLLATLAQPVTLINDSTAATAPGRNVATDLSERMVDSIVLALQQAPDGTSIDAGNGLSTYTNSSKGVTRKSLHYDVVPLGGECYPETLTLSHNATLRGPMNLYTGTTAEDGTTTATGGAGDAPNAPTLHSYATPGGGVGGATAYTAYTNNPMLSATARNVNEYRAIEHIHRDYIRSIVKHNNVRDCVLNLLLSTLTPDTTCLSHYLLGLLPQQQAQQMAQQQSRSQLSFNAAGQLQSTTRTAPSLNPISGISSSSNVTYCLDAIIDLLSPDSYALGTTFLQLHPHQATNCYELIYRLVASPVVRNAVIFKLNHRTVDFLRVHSTLLLYMTHLDDHELIPYGTDTNRVHAHVRTPAEREKVEAIKTAVTASVAWVLKTTSLMLFTLSTASNAQSLGSTTAGVKKTISSVLQLYYSRTEKLSFGAERSSDFNGLSKLLDYCTAFPALPSTVHITSPAVRECLSAASKPLRLSQAGAGYGGNNRFTAQDASSLTLLSQSLSFVDIRLLKQLLNERIQQQAAVIAATNTRRSLSAIRASAATVANLSAEMITAEQVKEAVRIAVHMNAYTMRVGALCHADIAYTQFMHVTSILTSNNSVASAFNAGSDLVPKTVLEQHFSPTFVYTECVVPLLNILLNTNRPLVDIMVYETLAKSLLSLVTFLCNCVTNSGASYTSIFSVEDHRYLLAGLVQLLLTRTSSTGSTTSVYYRGLLATALTSVLGCASAAATGAGAGASSNNTTSSDGVHTPSEEDKSGAEGEGSDGETDLAAYHEVTMTILERTAGDLAETLSIDILHAPPVWRCVAITLLAAVLNLLGPAAATREQCDDSDYRAAYGSHAFLQSVQLLVNKRYLAGMVAVIGGHGVGGGAQGEDLSQNESLFINTLTLCVHIATTAEGVEALVRCDVLNRINALTYFLNPPPLPSELHAFGPDAERNRQEAATALQNRLVPVLHLLNTMLAVAPANGAVVAGVATFLTRNSVIISQLLRLRYLSLTGLQMTELVASLFAVLVAASTQQQQPHSVGAGGQFLMIDNGSVPSVGNSNHSANKYTLDALFGTKADLFVSDICSLLGALGTNLIPASLTRGLHGAFRSSHPSHHRFAASETASGRGGNTWWDMVQPEKNSADKGHETVWKNTLYADTQNGRVTTAGGGSNSCNNGNNLSTNAFVLQRPLFDETLPVDWSLFDHMKLIHSLSIATHLATCLRSLTANVITSSRSNERGGAQGAAKGTAPQYTELLNVDTEGVCGLFTQCATQVLLFQQSIASARGASEFAPNSIAGNNAAPFGAAAATPSAAGGRGVSAQSATWLSSPQPVMSASHVRFADSTANTTAASTATPRPGSIASQYQVATTPAHGLLGVAGASAADQESAGYVKTHVLPRLIFTVENLVCVVHDMLQLSAPTNGTAAGAANPLTLNRSQALRVLSAVEGLLATVEHFPSHSFVRQTARWIKDVVDTQYAGLQPQTEETTSDLTAIGGYDGTGKLLAITAGGGGGTNWGGMRM